MALAPLMLIAGSTYLLQLVGKRCSGWAHSVLVDVVVNVLFNAVAVMVLLHPGAREMVPACLLTAAASAGLHGTAKALAAERRENRRWRARSRL